MIPLCQLEVLQLLVHSGGKLASQPLPFGTHPWLPDPLLRVFRYAQGISGGEGSILVIESDQLLQDECALSASKPVSQFRPFGLHESRMFACSEAVVSSDSKSRKAGCCIAVSSERVIRPLAVLDFFPRTLGTLSFLNSFYPTYS